MKRINWVVMIWGMLAAAAAQAQDLPAPPPLPELPGGTYDPSNPFAPPPAGLAPTPPQLPELPTPQTDGASSLPLPADDDDFEFFQGPQFGALPPVEGPSTAEQQAVVTPPPPRVIRRAPLPLYRFNYKNQILPEAIYKKAYNGENKHLPLRTTVQDYTNATFWAASQNNVNGVRAMLQSGGNIDMRNRQGETLVQVATRARAHDVLRYLVARGAETGGAYTIASSQGDAISLATLRSAGY